MSLLPSPSSSSMECGELRIIDETTTWCDGGGSDDVDLAVTAESRQQSHHKYGGNAHDERLPPPPPVELRMIEFFSGIGGMRLAVEGALQRHNQQDGRGQGEVVGRWSSLGRCQAYDISLHANRCYRHNFANDEAQKDGQTRPGGECNDVVCTKLVEQLKVSDLDGKADLWTLSPPCQPFTANKRGNTMQTTTEGTSTTTTTTAHLQLDSADKRCNGLKALIRLLTLLDNKPRYIFLENVKGFAGSEMVKEWFNCLRLNGYSWRSYLLSPVQFGIPNHRQRFYILCDRSSDRWSNVEDGPYMVPPLSSTMFSRPSMTVSQFIDPTLTIQKDNHKDVSVDDDDGSDDPSQTLKDYLVPDSVLQRDWAKNLGIVTGLDTATHCFTAGYGRIYHRSTGSLLLMEPTVPSGDMMTYDDNFGTKGTVALADEPLDRDDMTRYSGRLRKFTPQELLALFGFPKAYSFPNDIPMEHHYKLIGNSINVKVVTELIYELLFGWGPTQSPTTNDENDGDVELQSPGAYKSNVSMGTETDGATSTSNGTSSTTTGERLGGTKGHVVETMVDPLFLTIYRHYRWKMIPNCTGRYTCRDHQIASVLSPLALLEKAGIVPQRPHVSDRPEMYTFRFPDRSDRFLVVPLDEHNTVGLITFEKDGIASKGSSEGGGQETNRRYVHTLNTPSGFRRKLAAVGIHVTAESIHLIGHCSGCNRVDNT